MKHNISKIVFTTLIAVSVAGLASYALATGDQAAVTNLPEIEKIATSAKAFVGGTGKTLLGIGMVGAGGYGSLVVRSPVPLILSVVSTAILSLAVAAFTS